MLPVPGSSEARVVVVAVAGPALELRDFATGSDGKGPVGGAIEGRDGRGSEFADMLMALGAFVRVLPQLGELLAMHGWPDRPFAFFPILYATTYMFRGRLLVVTRTQIEHAGSELPQPFYSTFLWLRQSRTAPGQTGTWAREQTPV